MNITRIEYLRARRTELNNELKSHAVQINPWLYHDVSKRYNVVARELTFLEDIDHQIIFPHDWGTYEELHGTRRWQPNIRTGIYWPDCQIANPLGEREDIKRGGIGFPYNTHELPDLRYVVEFIMRTFAYETAIDRIMLNVCSANMLLRVIKHEITVPYWLFEGRPWDLGQGVINAILRQTERSKSLKYCQEESRERYPDVVRYATYAIFHRIETLDFTLTVDDFIMTVME